MSQIIFQHPHTPEIQALEKALEPVMRPYPDWRVRVTGPQDRPGYGFDVYTIDKDGQERRFFGGPPGQAPPLRPPEGVAVAGKSGMVGLADAPARSGVPLLPFCSG